jgi:hypothetical protein
MIAMVATTAAGIAEQVEIVRNDDELTVSGHETLIDNVIAGLGRLAAIGGAP